MEWSNGGSLLALAGSDKTIKIMDYKEKKIIKEIPTRHRGNFHESLLIIETNPFFSRGHTMSAMES